MYPTPRSNILNLPISAVLCGALLCCSVWAEASALTGIWILNEERSAQVQPEQLESRNWLGGGKVNTSVNVGGIPLPGGSSGKQKAMSDQPAKDPDILRCKRMEIESSGEDLQITYDELGRDLFRQGKYRGVTSRWDKKRLKSRYQTTTRKVTHDLQLQKDESLLVTVTIKADGSRKRTYKQVFERPGSMTNAKVSTDP
ncbi:MAG: hypothetical protein ACR2PZ_12530 [Pseudomonadales bacterium]